MLWTLKNKKLILIWGTITVSFKKRWHLSCFWRWARHIASLTFKGLQSTKCLISANICNRCLPAQRNIWQALRLLTQDSSASEIMSSYTIYVCIEFVLTSTLKQTALDTSFLLVPALIKWISVSFCLLRQTGSQKSRLFEDLRLMISLVR